MPALDLFDSLVASGLIFAVVDDDDPECEDPYCEDCNPPTCDLCTARQDEGFYPGDWNGETGNHLSCEEAAEDAEAPVSSPTMACECYSCNPEATE